MGTLLYDRKCAICEKMMYAGDDFVFSQYKWHGRVDNLPVHKLCAMPAEIRKKLEHAMNQAAESSPEEVSPSASSEASILDEIKGILKQYRSQGHTCVDYGRLEALIRMRESSNSKVTDTGYGNYQIRGGFVEALQHDGSESSATNLVNWITKGGGNVIRRFTEYDANGEPTLTYVRVESPRQPDLVGPGWWVTRTEDGFFFVVSDLDFHILYVEREG